MGSQTDQFVNSILRTAVGSLCQTIGWNSINNNALDLLADLMKKQFIQLSKSTHRYAEHYGRTCPNLNDAALTLSDHGIVTSELLEYVQNFDPVPLPYKVPQFPLPSESSLNFLRPGADEVLTRPVHIHEYMPPFHPMGVDSEKEKERDSQGPLPSTSAAASAVETISEVKSPHQQPPHPVVDKRPEEMEVVQDKDEVEEEDEEDELDLNGDSTPSIPFTPFSKSKRTDQPSENAALKRMRLMLEEEGHPTREVTSVILTSSGFLSSSREGRLPDSKPPPQRDFFEPTPPPGPLEKKRKILTMKKFLEGSKKVAERDEDEEEDEIGLFGNPDKIVTGLTPPKVKVKRERELEEGEIREVPPLKKVKGSEIKGSKLKIFKKKGIQDELKAKYDKKNLKKSLKMNKLKKGDGMSLKIKFPIPKPRASASTSADGLPRKRGRPPKVPGSGPTRPPPFKKGRFHSSGGRALPDLKSLVPEVSLNVPPPDLSLFSRLPSQPGLIPGGFGPPPLKFGGAAHSSISITPSTPNKEPSYDGLPVSSSVTITKIEMPSPLSGVLHTPPPPQLTPSPSIKGRQPPNESSGLTITPIGESEKHQPSPLVAAGLAKLEEELSRKTKEERRREKERRRELKKEKKKKREKDRDVKKDKKERKEEKERKKKNLTEGSIPKLTLKIGGSNTPTPRDSPVPEMAKKITILPPTKDEESTPDLARFAPLVTRPPKVSPPKKSPNNPLVGFQNLAQEIVGGGSKKNVDKKGGKSRGSGSSASGSAKGPGRPSKSNSNAGLVTETVGFFYDGEGNKIWICPACGRQDDGSPMIGCDTCDDWYHFTCVGITSEPDETESWFCKKCSSKKGKGGKESKKKY